MAISSTLYRFKIKLSDIDRGKYETLELRVAMHPSESVPYLLTRVLAFALNTQEGLEFTQGVSATDEPALYVKDLTGAILLWIEIGNPSARRLHKATKASQAVSVYTYRDPSILITETAGAEIHRVHEIKAYALSPAFLESVGKTIERDNTWELLHDDGELSLTVHNQSFQGEIRPVVL